MQRKYFSASFPYDETVTGMWVELIVGYLQELGDFLTDPVKTRAANSLRLHLCRVMARLVSQPQRYETMMNLQCVVFAHHMRVDVRFHGQATGLIDCDLPPGETAYQMDTFTLPSRDTPYPFTHIVEIKGAHQAQPITDP